MNDYEVKFTQEQVENYVKSVNWENRLKKEIPFMKKLFQEKNYKKILDLGCGPGKHASRLNEAGFDMTGIDIDEQMIDYANKKNSNLDRKIDFKVINVFDNPDELKNKFDAVYTLGNALMIIWTSMIDQFGKEKLLEIFQSLNNLLTPEGGLFFQILNSDNPRDGHVVSQITNEDKNNQMLVKHFIPIKSENKLYTTFSTLKWTDTNLKPEIFSIRKGFLYLVQQEELEKLLLSAGFSEVKFYENYNGKTFNKDSSDSLLCFAIKR